MHYTVEGSSAMNRTFSLLLGLLLVISATSCGGAALPPILATAEPSAAPTGQPLAAERVSPAALPQICNCVLRFDHIGIEQGLSQSSVHVIFQDSRGFLWFGTQ